MAVDWRVNARVSPGYFASTINRNLYYSSPWAIIDRKLLAIADGDCKRLIITMPPQHGKSELISKHLPAWYLGEYPKRKVILASYEASFAESWGAQALSIYKEYAPRVWGHTAVTNRAAWWHTDQGGYMATAGAGGPITGKGADLFIIDDPIKNQEEAHSKTMRDKVHNWFLSDVQSRLQPGGSIIVMHTRWHSDDLVGRLLRDQRDKWDYICLPAINDKNEVLFPQRYTLEMMEERRSLVGSYAWNSLYQQAPEPPEGNIIKAAWVRSWSTLPVMDKIFQSWDLTFKESGSSFVVGQLWGVSGQSSYLIDQVRGRWDFPETLRQIRGMKERYPMTREILIEEKANGSAIISTLKNEIAGIVSINPTESKEARASSVSFAIESGNVFIPLHCQWRESYLSEVKGFPNGENDDQVDATTQALNRIYTHSHTIGLRVAI